MWAEFLRSTDLIPETPTNEELQAYFSRIQIANAQFRMDRNPGWLSDRGMVFVALGEPDEIVERTVNQALTTTQISSTTRLQIWQYRQLNSQLVFYEAPQRLGETLSDLRAALGDRPALVGRELTKVHEELARGTLSALERQFSGEVRGEVVIVVRGASELAAADPALLEADVRARLAKGERPKQIAEALSGRYSKRHVYQLALKLKR